MRFWMHFLMIFGCKFEANSLSKIIKNVMNFRRSFWTHFGWISKAPYLHFCNTLHAKSRFLEFGQTYFWNDFGYILEAKIVPKSFPESIQNSTDVCIDSCIQNPQKIGAKTFPKSIKNPLKNQSKNQSHFNVIFDRIQGSFGTPFSPQNPLKCDRANWSEPPLDPTGRPRRAGTHRDPQNGPKMEAFGAPGTVKWTKNGGLRSPRASKKGTPRSQGEPDTWPTNPASANSASNRKNTSKLMFFPSANAQPRTHWSWAARFSFSKPLAVGLVGLARSAKNLEPLVTAKC